MDDGSIVITVRDITEPKKNELALQESGATVILEHNRLLSAIESFTDGFALFDAEDKFVMCNENYLTSQPLLSDLLTPGVTFEEILRTRIEREGGVYGSYENRDEAWIKNRLGQNKKTAEKMNNAPNTARHHLKSIFQKTEPHRQAELIRLVMSTPLWTHSS